MCLQTDMTLRDVWSEWTKGVHLGAVMESPLKELEEHKDTHPYRDPADGRLKTAVARRRHIAKKIEDEIMKFRFGPKSLVKKFNG